MDVVGAGFQGANLKAFLCRYLLNDYFQVFIHFARQNLPPVLSAEYKVISDLEYYRPVVFSFHVLIVPQKSGLRKPYIGFMLLHIVVKIRFHPSFEKEGIPAWFLKAAVSQIQSQDKQEHARRVKAGEIEAGELSEDEISPDTESLALVIQGKYCSGEIRRDLIRKAGKWYLVSTPEGTAWLPQVLFLRPVYKVGKIDKLITFLKKIARDSLDATAQVWPTTIKPTDKSRKCLVEVVYEDAWKIIQRHLIMTLPEHSITEIDGMSYAPSKIVKGNLGRWEKPKYASTPSFDGMIAEIETLVNEIRITDWQELKKICPPDEFDWTKSFKPYPSE